MIIPHMSLVEKIDNNNINSDNNQSGVRSNSLKVYSFPG